MNGYARWGVVATVGNGLLVHSPTSSQALPVLWFSISIKSDAPATASSLVLLGLLFYGYATGVFSSRKPGGGRKGALPTMRDKLLFVLYYVKVYPTFDVLGTQFNMARSKANENLYKLAPILYLRFWYSFSSRPSTAFASNLLQNCHSHLE